MIRFDQLLDVLNELTEEHNEISGIMFEMIALASHDEELKRILRNDYEENLKVVQEFVESQIRMRNVRDDISSRALSEALMAIYMRAAEKHIMGIDHSKIYDELKESVETILGMVDKKKKSVFQEK